LSISFSTFPLVDLTTFFAVGSSTFDLLDPEPVDLLADLGRSNPPLVLVLVLVLISTLPCFFDPVVGFDLDPLDLSLDLLLLLPDFDLDPEATFFFDFFGY